MNQIYFTVFTDGERVVVRPVMYFQMIFSLKFVFGCVASARF